MPRERAQAASGRAGRGDVSRPAFEARRADSARLASGDVHHDRRVVGGSQALLLLAEVAIDLDALDPGRLEELASDVAAGDLAEQGAQALLIACTELSTLASGLDTELPVFDASQLLVQEIVRQARGSGVGTA